MNDKNKRDIHVDAHVRFEYLGRSVIGKVVSTGSSRTGAPCVRIAWKENLFAWRYTWEVEVVVNGRCNGCDAIIQSDRTTCCECINAVAKTT